MRRKLNVRLLVIVLGSLTILAIGIHFLHEFQLRQNAYRLLEQGDRALEAKDFDKAMTFYGQYLTFVPNDSDTLQKYAQAIDVTSSNAADRVQVILLMEQVLRTKPNEHELRFRLIHNLIALDRIAEAAEHLRKLQRNWPDKAQVLHMLGWCQEAKEDYLHAVQSFEQAIAQNPKRIETYALLIEVLYERRNLVDEAQKAADEMVQKNPASFQAYLVRARFQRRRGDDKAAQSDLESAFQLAPDRPEVILALADAARAQNDWERATKLLQNGLKAHPDHADLYKLMVDVKLQTGQRSEALDVARAGVTNVPRSTELAVVMIDLLIDEKQYTEASRKIDELLQTGIKPALPNYLTARLTVADKKWSEAITLLDGVATDLGPGSQWHSRVHALLGLCHRNLGDREMELQSFGRAVAEEPRWLMGNLGLAAALLDAGRSDEAIQTLDLVNSGPELPYEYWILQGRCQLAQQLRRPVSERRWEKIDEFLARAAAADPKGVDVPLIRAAVLTAQSDADGALALLEKTRSEHPRDVFVRCALADLAVRQGRRDEAEKILALAEADLGDRLELRLARCRLWGGRGNASDRAKLSQLAEGLPGSFNLEQRTQLQRELADTWRRLGEADRAEKWLRQIATSLPKDMRSRSMLLDLALEKRQAAAVRTLLEEMRRIEGGAGLRWQLGAIALQIQEARGQRSQLEDARRKLQELAKTHKSSPRLALLTATVLDLQGESQAAIREYSLALELGEKRPSTLGRVAQLLMQRHEYAAAEAEFVKYERHEPLTKELARLGAEVALSMRDERYAKSALARAEQAVPLPARDYRDALWLAHVYQSAGVSDKAERVYEQCLAQAGDVPDVWVAWMQYLAATEQRSRAPLELDRLIAELPAGRQPLTLARCYDALRHNERAAKAYRALVRADSNDFIVLGFAADFFERAGQITEAQPLYERLIDPRRAAPEDTVIHARRRLAVLLASQNIVASRNQALALIDANPLGFIADERIRLYVQSLASAAARQETLDKFQKLLPRTPPTADERVLHAKMIEAAGSPNQACAQLVQVMNEHPNAPQYLAYFVHLLIRSNDLDEAERHLKHLEALEPTSERTRAALRTTLTRAATKD